MSRTNCRPWIGCALLLAWLTVFTAGCEGRNSSNKPPDFSAYGILPGAAKSGDVALQDELARLLAEGATPSQLESEQPVIAADQNVAAGLATILTAEKVMRANNDVDDIYPRDHFVWSSGALERSRDLLRYHQVTLTAMKAVLDRPECQFDVKYASGLLADVGIFDTAQLAQRWEALDTAALLADGELEPAEKNVLRMLRLDHQLAQVKHLVPRLEGATLRLETLRVLEAFVQHPNITPDALARVRAVLQQQLEEWPSDADAWNGDRAIGLHTYEMIRHGYVLSILTDDELSKLRQEAGVSPTAKGIIKNIDADERFYVDTMRELIAACEKPYHQRRELILKVNQHLKDTEQTPQYPLIAAKILLVDVEAGHRLQAEDRAACEGWLLALSAALGEELPPYKNNPLTGVAYTLERDEGRILVHNALIGEPAEAIIVPRFDR
ncbi:MAG TPA: hypothetical protein VL096_18290 [Pirellulaceae bacterium]|nr:hypothetical protein [Pirellulaceae bacterium]